MPNPKETAARRPPERPRPEDREGVIPRFFETIARLEGNARLEGAARPVAGTPRR